MLYQLSYSRLRAHVLAHVETHRTDGEGRIRTSEGVRRQIYSLLPLATRESLQILIHIATTETS